MDILLPMRSHILGFPLLALTAKDWVTISDTALGFSTVGSFSKEKETACSKKASDCNEKFSNQKGNENSSPVVVATSISNIASASKCNTEDGTYELSHQSVVVKDTVQISPSTVTDSVSPNALTPTTFGSLSPSLDSPMLVDHSDPVLALHAHLKPTQKVLDFISNGAI